MSNGRDHSVTTRKLSVTTAKAVQPGDVLKCDEVHGLQLRGLATGAYWYLYHRANGTQRKPSIGRYPALSIADARKVARAMLMDVAQGRDVSEERRAKRAAPLVIDLCDRYLIEWAEKRKAPSSVTSDRGNIDRHIRPVIGHLRVADVTRADIDQLLDGVRTRKRTKGTGRKRSQRRWASHKEAPVAANRVRALLAKMFALAETDFDMRPQKSNPVYGAVKNRERGRRRLASPDELAAIAHATSNLAKTHPRHAACILTIFLTGARISEIHRATYGEWKQSRLELTEHKTAKSIGDKTIYLPPAVDQLLKQVVQTENVKDGDRLFGAIDLRWVWDRIRTEAGCPDLWLRDARRTFASYALSSGAMSLSQIGQVFGHTNPQTTNIYTWLLDDPRRQLAADGSASVFSVWERGSSLQDAPSLRLSAPASGEPVAPSVDPSAPRQSGLAGEALSRHARQVRRLRKR
jgi:integrase